MEKIQYEVVESNYCSARPFVVRIVGEGWVNPIKGRYPTHAKAESARRYFQNKK